MIVQLYESDSRWYCRVELEPHEWPVRLDESPEVLMQGTMYQWCLNNCEHSHLFLTYRGVILFEHEDDAARFILAWG